MQEQNMSGGAENFNQEKKFNGKMFLLGLLGFLALALAAALAVGIYRVYAKAATDGFTLTVARVLRLPAFKADDKAVLYVDYADDLRAIRAMRDFDKKNNGENAELTDQQMSDQVLWRLLNNVLLDKAAKTYNLKVQESDLRDLKRQVMQNFKNEDEANKEIKERYGWDFATYQKKVMSQYVLQSKLDQEVQGDKKLLDEQFVLANKVLTEVKGGADFAELAKKYGQDGTAAAGGDLGWFAKGEMVPAFETAAFALKKGELAKDPVETEFGFHVLKVTDKKTEKKKDAKGKTTSVAQVRASHILFRRPNASQYLDKLARQANLHLYIAVHDPFAGLKK
ncbi:hypothetical protein EPN28_04215 [Patescibacteria group bacterium]|nr:MAG: hypothetical protein EPN28_04215 [Patescibacteria group bacterium]